MISAFASYGVEWDTTTAERRRRRGIYLEGWRRGLVDGYIYIRPGWADGLPLYLWERGVDVEMMDTI